MIEMIQGREGEEQVIRLVKEGRVLGVIRPMDDGIKIVSEFLSQETAVLLADIRGPIPYLEIHLNESGQS